MKRSIALILCVILAFSLLAGCGGKNSDTTSASSSQTSSQKSSKSSSSSKTSSSAPASSDTASSSSSSAASSSSASSTASSTDTASSQSSEVPVVTRREIGNYTPSGSRLLPIYCVKTTEKVCAISFDAAWGADETEHLLQILDEYNIKTTFFLMGDWVDKHPDMVKKIFDAGHDVMNHSNTHADLATISVDAAIKEIEACNDKIEAITGVRPVLIRLPYGSYNNEVCQAVRNLGMEPIQWDVDSWDWMENITKQDIYDRLTTQIQPGSIILCHNAGQYTPAAIPEIFEKMQGEGYKFVKIYDLILKGDYTIDVTGRQKPLA